MDDPRRDPELLKRYLVGGEYFDKLGRTHQRVTVDGLIRRVRRRVEGMVITYLPPHSLGGSIARGKGGVAGGLEDAARIIELARAVDLWMGQRRDLSSFLKRHRISDRDFLCGSPGVGDGALERARRRVITLLGRSARVDECLVLMETLLEWAELGCNHHFRPLNAEFVRCDRCGLGDPDSHIPDGGRVRASDLIPQVRCEVCRAPIIRDSADPRGRERRTCSDACRKRLERSGVA